MHGEKVNSISGQTDSVACGWCSEIAGCMHGQIDLLKRPQLQHNLYSRNEISGTSLHRVIISSVNL